MQLHPEEMLVVIPVPSAVYLPACSQLVAVAAVVLVPRVARAVRVAAVVALVAAVMRQYRVLVARAEAEPQTRQGAAAAVSRE